MGYHQQPEAEVNLAWCRRIGLPVIQRETGGGMVYIDSNQVFAQWVFAPERLPRRVDQRFGLFVRALAEALAPLGLEATLGPPNDLHIGGRKVSGTGAAAIGRAEVVTGNYLLDFDYEAMQQVLAAPHPAFAKAFAEALAQWLTTLRRELGHPPEPEALKRYYRAACSRILQRPVVAGTWTPEEEVAIAQMEARFAGQQARWQELAQKPQPAGVRAVKVQAGVWVATAPIEGADGEVRWLTLRTRDRRIDQAVWSGPPADMPPARLEALGRMLHLVEMDEAEVLEVAEAWWQLHDVSRSVLRPELLADAIARIRKAAPRAPFAAGRYLPKGEN